MARSCSPPKTVSVGDYVRSLPRRRKKRKPKTAAGQTYWTCVDASGTTCGTHHRSSSASYKHARMLNRQDRRRGRKATWDTEKKTG